MVSIHTTCKRILGAATLLSLVLSSTAMAVCPGDPGGGLGVFYMDMRTGVSIDTTGHVSVAPLPPVSAPGCTDGSKMGVVQIDVPADCSEAVVTIEYQGSPTGHTVNLGDSGTNNGFGGDAGTSNNAEVHILGENLSLYNHANGPQEVDRLVSQDLALTDGAIKFRVSDQSVSWGQPLTTIDSEGLERLFTFSDPVDNRTIYLGLNRVVANTSRTGCGVKRVLISFE